ncbi:hypothetical protein EBU95_02155 [bacterium]|nr:hypothetical protein [bacterium]
MNLDENDILSTNVFVNAPELEGETGEALNEEFKKYYKKTLDESEERKLRRSLDRISLRSVSLTDETDESNMLHTNSFTRNYSTPSIRSGTRGGPPGARAQEVTEPKRLIKEVKSYISIDSRDRNKLIYPKASKFKIFLGKSFYNVRTIRLASMEFPNTNAVINSNNNMIYWRNEEDIRTDTTNSLTNMYPVYNVQLRIGSYIASSLQTEMTTSMNQIKRRNGIGDFHYFDVVLDISTDIVTFTSLILTQLPNNPISTTVGLGVLIVSAPSHNYSTGDTIYLLGVKTVAGIPAGTINTSQRITVINANEFSIEVNVKAADTVQGGGNVVNSGRIAPFQLLFGEHDKTVAQNIGYPLENSSQKLTTYIKSIQNLNQIKVRLAEPHLLRPASIGSLCQVSSSGTVPNIDGNKVITSIFDNSSIYISADNLIDGTVFNSGQLTVGGRTIDILSIENVTMQTVLVTTHTPHNYTNDDVNLHKVVTFQGTSTIPSLDGANSLFSVLSSTELMFPGYILSNVVGTWPENTGYFSQNTPLQTHTVPISSINLSGAFFTVVCTEPHKVLVGDIVSLYGISSIPPLTSVRVHAVPSPTTFIVNSSITTFDQISVNNGLAYVGTGLITVTFPDHNFNKIIQITNVGLNLVRVQTQLPHGYIAGDKVRVSGTDSVPTLDGGYTIQSATSDTFTIPFGTTLTQAGTTGVLRYHQDFYVYSATKVGEIETTQLNNVLFTVRDIIDKDTFTFYNNGAQARLAEKGGGNNVFISSLVHGFNGIQTNTKNDLLNRSINLQGENYAFLCCPQLSTMMNTGKVNDIFARVTLDQSPGNMVFSFLSNPKEFTTIPLDTLNELEFSIVNYDGSYYEFNDLDYSFTLEITEQIDVTESFNISSKRGISVN